MMEHISYKASLLFLGISAALCGIFLFMIFWPFNVITPNVQPYKILTKKVIPGGELIYQVNACKHMEAHANIQRRFVSDVIYFLPSESGTVRKGCAKSNIALHVPDDVQPGTYYLELIIDYPLNILNTKTYYFQTEKFEVATPPAKLQ